MKASVIIQARIGSSRLPDKVLLKLADKTVLEHVISRAKKAQAVGEIIVATTEHKEDDRVTATAISCGAKVYRVSEQDVLDRYFQAAKSFCLKDIVRITADCPIIDPKLIDQVVEMYFQTKADYCSNTLVPTFPDGEDIEVFSFRALSKAWQEAQLSSEREHVTPYIKKNKSIFKTVSFETKPNYSQERWTLDEEEDYRFLKIIFDELYPVNAFFEMKEVLTFLQKHPDLERMNKNIIRNEGYKKSLKKDKIEAI